MFGNLGSTLEDCNREMESLRKAWGNLARTNHGQELSHLAKVMEISMETQSVCYPVITGGTYEGAILLGYGYKIVHGEHVYVPGDKLNDIVLNSYSHSASLKGILDILGSDAMETDSIPMTMRALAKRCALAKLSVTEKEKIKSLAKSLRFNESFWGQNPEKVKRVLEYLGSTEEIPQDVPLHHTQLFYNDRLEEVLSAFGSMSITLDITSAPKINLERDGKVPDVLVYRLTDLNAAIASMRQVKNSKILGNNPKNMSALFACRRIPTSEKDEVWKYLKTFANLTITPENVQEATESRTPKRPRVEADF